MPNQINYAHHEMDPVLMSGNEALIFIHGHWQSMIHALAFSEATLMTEEEFYGAFGTIADHLPPRWRKAIILGGPAAVSPIGISLSADSPP
jgi:hypothetical protein